MKSLFTSCYSLTVCVELTACGWAGYDPADIVTEEEGGRVGQHLKSVIDVTRSSQALGLAPKGDGCQDIFISWQQGVWQCCTPLGTIYFSHKLPDMNQFC